MPATQTLEFKFPVEVTLEIGSVTSDWIEGNLILILFGHKETHHFKTKNNYDDDFNIPVVDAKVHFKVYLENPKKVCAEGYVEKKIIVSVKVPFHVCKDF